MLGLAVEQYPFLFFLKPYFFTGKTTFQAPLKTTSPGVITFPLLLHEPGYEVQHYILETKWRRMRGRTWLERNGDMPMFSSKNSKEYKMVESGNIWGDSSDSSVFLVYLTLFTCAWFADLKREITLNPLHSKIRYSFSASLPKKVQCMLWRRCLSTARAIFSKLVFGSGLRPSPTTRSENIAITVKRPHSPPWYAMYYFLHNQ